jgi:hypothetical protein
VVVPAHIPWEALMPAALLVAHFTDEELSLRNQARAAARHTLPDPSATARALAWPSARLRPGCARQAAGADLSPQSVGGGRQSDSAGWRATGQRHQCPADPGPGAPTRARGCCGGNTPGQRAVFIALRLEAVPGRWELIELLTNPPAARPAGMRPSARLAGYPHREV